MPTPEVTGAEYRIGDVDPNAKVTLPTGYPRAGTQSRTLVGVDGCPDGWVAVIETDGALDAFVVADFPALLSRCPEDAIVAIDVPIGLPEAGSRPCDTEVRKFLKAPRSSSVFPAPVRPCLQADVYDVACELHRSADGRSLSRQAFSILKKIREVDAVLEASPALQDRVREVHPEVSFALWNGGAAMLYSKKRNAGRTEREALIDHTWTGQRGLIATKLSGHRYNADDLNDAFAALWTARRIAAGNARTFGTPTVRDQLGLRMEIVA